MKIQIENLRAQMRGVQLTSYQRALALDEYYKLLDYVEELEQLTIPTAIVSLLERAASLVGNPGTNISGSTDMACDEWQKDYERWRNDV